jgi:hypothetical protein
MAGNPPWWKSQLLLILCKMSNDRNNPFMTLCMRTLLLNKIIYFSEFVYCKNLCAFVFHRQLTTKMLPTEFTNGAISKTRWKWRWRKREDKARQGKATKNKQSSTLLNSILLLLTTVHIFYCIALEHPHCRPQFPLISDRKIWLARATRKPLLEKRRHPQCISAYNSSKKLAIHGFKVWNI